MDYYPLVIQDSHEKWMNMAHVQMIYIHIYIDIDIIHLLDMVICSPIAQSGWFCFVEM